MRCKKILFLIGICIFLYPSISDWWNSFHQSLVIRRYGEEMSQIDEKNMKEWKEEALLYNKKIEKRYMEPLSKEEQFEYASVFDMYEDGLIGYIEIPVINVRLPFYHGTEESVLQIGAGHMEGTSFPAGGMNSHCVLSGHRGLPSARLFTGLDQLRMGDVFRICVLNEEYDYQVYKIQTVLPEETSLLKIEKDKDLCTLVTCTPYGINSHRLLVSGIRIEKGEEMSQTEESFMNKKDDLKGKFRMQWKSTIKWSVLCLLIVFFWLSSNREVKAWGQTDVLEESDKKTFDLEVQYRFPGITFWLCEIAGDGKEYDLDCLEPMKTGNTNTNGQIRFEDISPGSYVILGEEYREQGYRFVPVITELELPFDDRIETGKIVIRPKFEKIPEETEKENNNDLEESLPQTGQPWLLVLFFIFAGAFFLVLAAINGFRE